MKIWNKSNHSTQVTRHSTQLKTRRSRRERSHYSLELYGTGRDPHISLRTSHTFMGTARTHSTYVQTSAIKPHSARTISRPSRLRSVFSHRGQRRQASARDSALCAGKGKANASRRARQPPHAPRSQGLTVPSPPQPRSGGAAPSGRAPWRSAWSTRRWCTRRPGSARARWR